MKPFKNYMSPTVVSLIAHHLGKHIPAFDEEAFTRPILKQLPALELKERTQVIADALHAILPSDFAKRNSILTAMLHPDPFDQAFKASDEDGICGWGLWPLTMVVGQHGLDDFDGSLALLKNMTKRGTSEFDVRPFLDADQTRALRIIIPWAKDENHHVRRLASEGTRPRLPWGMQLKQLVADPKPAMPILFAMRDDPEEYVRRSVANHINDIAKDHPDLVAGLANDWMVDAPIPRQKLVRHACRTLIKQGHPNALKAFGITPPQIEQPTLSICTKSVEMGNALSFAVQLKSTSSKPQKIVIDYVVHFQKANGTLAPKVFKWTKLEMKPNQQVELSRNHAIKPITTRKYYSGEHALSLRINGKDFGYENFDLTV